MGQLLYVRTLLGTVQGWNILDDRINLQDVHSLTLHKDKYTTGRRLNPILQLSCVGGKAKHYSGAIQVVECINMGADDHGVVQWMCETDMESTIKFGTIEVTCEGYNHPNDKYILPGSCGLEYTLEYTNEGELLQQSYPYYLYNKSPFYFILAMLAFIGSILSAIYVCAQHEITKSRHYPRTLAYRRRHHSSGGSGIRVARGFGGTKIR